MKKIVFGSIALIAILAGLVVFLLLNRKPEIPATRLDYHAGAVNKLVYQQDDLLKEMDRELGTKLSSKLSPEFVGET